jgi:hypothetical protein
MDKLQVGDLVRLRSNKNPKLQDKLGLIISLSKDTTLWGHKVLVEDTYMIPWHQLEKVNE